jgi:hypothetical protein
MGIWAKTVITDVTVFSILLFCTIVTLMMSLRSCYYQIKKYHDDLRARHDIRHRPLFFECLPSIPLPTQ